MRVILIRHGQTDWNEDGIFRGRIDLSLNKTGVKQTKKVCKRLKKVPVDKFYSSPLRRAVETAEIIEHPHNLGVKTVNDLNDIDFGKWQGLAREEIERTYPEVYRIWITRPDIVEIPEAETLDQVRRRVSSGLDAIFNKHPDETVAIISHGLINKIMICIVLDLDNSHFWKIKQDNCAINIFEYTNDGSKLYLMNDIYHVESFRNIIESMKNPEDPLG